MIARPTGAASYADGRVVMKVVCFVVGLAVTATLAHAEDMAAMISQYRREHGLSAVKTDPQLTEIAERQAKAMAAAGIMDHNVAGSFGSRISGRAYGPSSRKHRGRHQDLGRDIPCLADLAGPQRQPSATAGR